MLAFDDAPLWLIFLLSLLLLFAAIECGCLLYSRAKQAVSSDIHTLEASILGLLALMIGFTFSMSLARYDMRRDEMLKEANAIGTAALRARLLPDPHSSRSLDLLRQYVGVRLDLIEANTSSDALREALKKSGEIQEALWQEVKAVAVLNNSPVPTGMFIESLNNMIDSQEKRLDALRNRVPGAVLFALYCLAIISMAFSGYASSSRKPVIRTPIYVTGCLIAMVILLIQDLDRPNKGLIRTNQQSIIDVARAIEGYR